MQTTIIIIKNESDGVMINVDDDEDDEDGNKDEKRKTIQIDRNGQQAAINSCILVNEIS